MISPLKLSALALAALVTSLGYVSINSTEANENAPGVVRPDPLETPFLSEEDYDDFEENGLAFPLRRGEEASADRRACGSEVCEGDRVRVVKGSLRGFTGIVIQADTRRQKYTIVTDTQIRSTVSADSIRAVDLKADCVASFCRGDKAKIAGRWNKGFQGYIVGFDRERNQARLRRTHSGPTVETHLLFLRHARF